MQTSLAGEREEALIAARVFCPNGVLRTGPRDEGGSCPKRPCKPSLRDGRTSCQEPSQATPITVLQLENGWSAPPTERARQHGKGKDSCDTDIHAEPIHRGRPSDAANHRHTQILQTSACTERHRDKQTDVTNKHRVTYRHHEAEHKHIHRETHKHAGDDVWCKYMQKQADTVKKKTHDADMQRRKSAHMGMDAHMHTHRHAHTHTHTRITQCNT